MIKQFRKVMHNTLGIGTQRIHFEKQVIFDKIPIEINSWIESRFPNKDLFIAPEETDLILRKAYEHYCNVFGEMLAQEQSYEFYDWCVDRLEDMIQSKVVTTGDIAPYYLNDIKRALRVIVERAGNLKLSITNDSFFEQRFALQFNKLFEPFFNALYVTNLICYYRIVEGSLTIALRDSQYEIVEGEIAALQRRMIKTDMIIQERARIGDPTLSKQLKSFLAEELMCNWEDFRNGLSSIAHHLIRTRLMPMEWEKMIDLFCSVTKTPVDRADYFFKGVYFMPDHLSSMEQRISKRTIEKQMFRPLLIWNLNGKPVVTFRSQAFAEAINFLLFDVMPWNKELIPKEWRTYLKGAEYFEKKQRRVGDILEEKVKEILQTKGLLFIKNALGENQATKLREIENDFLILNKEQTTLWIVECKNLMKRFDGNGWIADKERFFGEDGFFKNMEKKIRIVPNHFDMIQSRFVDDYGSNALHRPILEMKIRSVFVLNSPSVFMYMKGPVVFSWKHFELFIQHDFQSPFLIHNESDMSYSSPLQVIGNFQGMYAHYKKD